MKKSLAFLTGICLALSSGFTSAAIIAGWNVGNPTPVGAAGLVIASKSVGDVAKTSKALITPNASQVSKILRGGVAGVALTVAVNELLDGIDWVMDPANNQVKYKESVGTFCVWTESYCGSTPYEACKAYGQIVSGGWKYNSVTGYCDTWNRDGETTNLGIIVRGELKEKTLSLDTASQKVIDNAQSGNTDAQVATVAAAQDILNEAENDAEKAKPIVQQLENNSTNADPNNPDPDDDQANQDKIDRVLKDTIARPATKGRARQYDKNGGVSQANADFDSMGLSNIKNIPNGRMGQMNNGTMVNVRSTSSGKEPTLEIQIPKKPIKIRYN